VFSYLEVVWNTVQHVISRNACCTVLSNVRGLFAHQPEPTRTYTERVTFALEPMTVPLYDAGGTWRVKGSRVNLELVLLAFKEGVTPEGIVQRYASLSLPSVYAVIAYYLDHRAELDAYLEDQSLEAERIRAQVEEASSPRVTRAELEGRLSQKRSGSA
jgi:uncharacterized protein (DUF433 family)